jgi:hypothetical protein
MSVIVPTAVRSYVRGMTAALLKLMTLFALVLMSLSMTSAPAAASSMPASHHMTAGHCDEQPDQDQTPASKMDCAAMCTALPATDAAAPTPVLKLEAPRTIAVATLFEGIILEIATPPPRLG